MATDNTSATMPWSLFDTLTKLTAEPADVPAALDLVALLLKVVGRDACDASRNTHGLYRLTGRARDLTNIMIKLIEQVDTSEDFDEASASNIFKLFDRYTVMINPLENLLYRIACLATGEDADLKTLVNDEILQLIQPFHEWDSNRKTIKESLASLVTEQALKNPETDALKDLDVDATVRYDDLGWLAAVSQSTASNRLAQKTDLLGTAIKTLGATLNSLQTTLKSQEISDDVVVLSVRAAMVMYGVVTLAEKTKDRALRLRLRHVRETWTRADGIIKQLLTHAQSRQGEFASIQTSWEAFETYLLGPANLLPLVATLLPKVARIRRHWRARAVVLVHICVELELQTRNLQHEARKVDKLVAALDLSTKALDSAIEAMKTVGLENHAWTDIEAHATTAAITAAIESLKTAFQDHALTSQKEAKMADALEEDKSAMTKLGQEWGRLQTKAARTVSHDSRKVAVNLCKRKASGAPSTPDKVLQLGSLASSTTLDALMWKLNPGFNVSALKPKFYTSTGGSPPIEIFSGTKISSIQENGGLVTIFLEAEDIAPFQAQLG